MHGQLVGDKLMQRIFHELLKGDANYWAPQAMQMLCHPLLTQLNESFMKKRTKVLPKVKEQSRTPCFRQRTAMVGCERNFDARVHVVTAEQQLGYRAGQFMMIQLDAQAREIKKMVDKRQGAEDRARKKTAKQKKTKRWATSSKKTTTAMYLGHGGGFSGGGQ